MSHENCALVFIDNAFTITGCDSDMCDNGDWDGETYYTVNITQLDEIHAPTAQRARDLSLSDCEFTTAYGDLIAIRNNKQCAVLY